MATDVCQKCQNHIRYFWQFDSVTTVATLCKPVHGLLTLRVISPIVVRQNQTTFVTEIVSMLTNNTKDISSKWRKYYTIVYLQLRNHNLFKLQILERDYISNGVKYRTTDQTHWSLRARYRWRQKIRTFV